MKPVYLILPLAVLSLMSIRTIAAPQPDLLLDGKYAFPLKRASDRHLAPYNNFSIHDYRIIRQVTDREVMRFALPKDLTGGDAITIELQVKEKVGDKRKLQGAKGSAICQGAWVAITCDFKFKNLKLSANKIEKYLALKYGPSEKGQALQQIAMRLMNDPIGVGKTEPRNKTCEGCSQGNGSWKVSVAHARLGARTGVVELNRDSGEFYSNEFRGSLQNVRYAGAYVTADFITDRGSHGVKGWVRAQIQDSVIRGDWGFAGETDTEGSFSGQR